MTGQCAGQLYKLFKKGEKQYWVRLLGEVLYEFVACLRKKAEEAGFADPDNLVQKAQQAVNERLKKEAAAAQTAASKAGA